MAAQPPPPAPAPGETYFDKLEHPFYRVVAGIQNVGGQETKIPTEEFLNAAKELTGLFDLLGSAAFTPVKSDMTGNITKVSTRFTETNKSDATLQDLVTNELAQKKHTAVEGLLWLTRGLDFTAQALRHNLSHPTEELSTSFRDAYGKTLKQYHSFMIKPIFSAAMSATPYRKDFEKKLAGGQEPVGEFGAKLREQLEQWVAALERVVAIINEFLARKENQWK